MKRYFVALLISMFGLFNIANATIVYEVNRTIGAGTVTGYIETDGTLGSLSFANITDWSLDIFAPNLNGGVLTSSNYGAATFGNASLVTATLTDLIFDFDINGVFGFWTDSTNDWWCLAGGPGGNNGCFTSPAESIGYSDSSFNYAQYTDYTGQVIFASVATNVSEPGVFALIILGLAGLLLRRREIR